MIESFEDIGFKRITEINGPEQIGVTKYHLTQSTDPGIRSSTAQEYLLPIKSRKNFYLLKNSLVTKILLDSKNSAHGVEIILENGEKINVYANKEVIVSAGAINTPQLLMLSGIGPTGELKSFNIEPKVNLPVGLNLMDHLFVPIFLTVDTNLLGVNLTGPATLDTPTIPQVATFFKLNPYNVFQEYPDFQLMHSIYRRNTTALAFFCSYFVQYSDEACTALVKANADKDILLLFVVLLHPKSRGRVTIRSSDPKADPKINLSYFSEDEDLENTVQAIKKVISLRGTTFYRNSDSEVVDLNLSDCKDYKFMSHEYWRCYSRGMASTLWHPVGTCSMEPKGVVDNKLKVYYTNKLRVVDASVIPFIPSGNTNAPTIMLAEKASDIIKNEYLK